MVGEMELHYPIKILFMAVSRVLLCDAKVVNFYLLRVPDSLYSRYSTWYRFGNGNLPESNLLESRKAPESPIAFRYSGRCCFGKVEKILAQSVKLKMLLCKLLVIWSGKLDEFQYLWRDFLNQFNHRKEYYWDHFCDDLMNFLKSLKLLNKPCNYYILCWFSLGKIINALVKNFLCCR